MPKPIGKREARRLAFANAAGLIAAEDLSSLFGDDASDQYDDEESVARLTAAQQEVVAYLRKRVRHEND